MVEVHSGVERLAVKRDRACLVESDYPCEREVPALHVAREEGVRLVDEGAGIVDSRDRAFDFRVPVGILEMDFSEDCVCPCREVEVGQVTRLGAYVALDTSR